jgi:tetrahydromethanopterin S-methyltransferase subunit E
MTGLTLRVLAALAAGALVLAFVSALFMVSSQSSLSVSTRPLVQYGSR